MNKVILNTDFALLTLDKKKNTLELTWKQQSNTEIYKETFLTALDIASNKFVKYFLSDIREQGVVSIGDMRWLSEYIIPKVHKLGIEKVAIILVEDIFSTIYAELVEKNLTENNVDMKIFIEKTNAYTWFFNNSSDNL